MYNPGERILGKKGIFTKQNHSAEGKSNEKTLYCLSGCRRRIHDGRL
jgi:hypothetical protein